MTPIRFPQANAELTAPLGCPEVGKLSVFRDGERCISAWRASWRERLSILVFGRVWLRVWSGRTQPPVSVEGARTAFLSQRQIRRLARAGVGEL